MAAAAAALDHAVPRLRGGWRGVDGAHLDSRLRGRDSRAYDAAGAQRRCCTLWHTDPPMRRKLRNVALTLNCSSFKTDHRCQLSMACVAGEQNLADAGISLKGSKTPKQQRTIVFVLGGPGSGKGTQVKGRSRCSMPAS